MNVAKKLIVNSDKGNLLNELTKAIDDRIRIDVVFWCKKLKDIKRI